MKKLITILTALTAVSLFAAEEVLFNSNFEKNKTLKGWFEVQNGYNQGVPRRTPARPPISAKVITTNGETYMKAGRTAMSMTHPFSKPVVVNDSLKRIAMKVVLRQTPKSGTTLIRLSMTSRLQPAATDGGPFWRGRDSGVAIQGYTYNAFAPNFIYWRMNGGDNKKYPAVRPYNLFPKSTLTKWTTCSLIYDHEKKTFTFECEGKKPLIYHNVDLKGVVLNAACINMNHNEYKSIVVTCEKK